ncbi:MAG: FAD-binding oxidoreductase [Halobacteriota archaeon]|nr:FAD-binding oxidoreductase [Halobacteriota archaeon]
MKKVDVVKPKTSEDISAIVKCAINENKVIIPMGGDSWIYGGVVPDNGIVLDLRTMDSILEIDKENLKVTVEAGMNWEGVCDALSKKGFMVGSYPTNASSATVGGWINTGGYGIGSYKYGGIGEQIRSLEVVLPNGKIINTGFKDVVSNSSGYNLNGMFVGAEGTLGIISKASLKIYPKEDLRALSYSYSDMSRLFEAIYLISRSKIVPLNISFADKNHYDFIRSSGIDAPEGPMLNVALKGPQEMMDYEEKIIDQLSGSGKKESKEVSNQEWDSRYNGGGSDNLSSAVMGEAFAPIPHLIEMIGGIYEITEKMKLKASVNGTVVDRNTVLLMPYYLTNDDELLRRATCMAFMKKVDELGAEYGGGAVMGVYHAFSEKKSQGEDTSAMQDIKAVFDPLNIMNPLRSP